MECTKFTLDELEDTLDLGADYLHNLLSETAVSEPIATVTTELFSGRRKAGGSKEEALDMPDVSEWATWVS